MYCDSTSLGRVSRSRASCDEISPVVHEFDAFLKHVSAGINLFKCVLLGVSERLLQHVAVVKLVCTPRSESGAEAMHRGIPSGYIADDLVVSEKFAERIVREDFPSG